MNPEKSVNRRAFITFCAISKISGDSDTVVRLKLKLRLSLVLVLLVPAQRPCVFALEYSR